MEDWRFGTIMKACRAAAETASPTLTTASCREETVAPTKLNPSGEVGKSPRRLLCQQSEPVVLTNGKENHAGS